MKLVFAVLLFSYLVCGSFSSPTELEISPFSNHKNFNLLSPRGICGIQSLQDKIFGGNVTSIDEFPWMALLRYSSGGNDTGFQCTGILINDRYVLTAAHCLKGRVNRLYGEAVKVRFGEHDLTRNPDCETYDEGEEVCSDPPVDIDIEQNIPHAMYDDVRKYNDIALVRLAKSVQFSSYIKTICLPLNGEKSAPGMNLTASGWGKTEKLLRSPVKLKVKLPVMEQQKCAKIYKATLSLIDSQLCAGGKKNIDSCNGDSGGPLMKPFPDHTEYYLEGIVSFGLKDCGTSGVPGVYTRVSSFIDWILDNIKP